ncbi:transglycosylase family protein [Streptomyces sp. NPDC050085]|uniref:transglycosylase family protein n=1 Tax=Streptomyces sp. NPDC050085 TaxID=3365600 RepID=UPI0037B15621
MLSGNGRHRRPRQAPALVVAAGITGSAIAIPLLAATNASAASTTTWDKLAECESGGQWSLDAGNGYYGGLQFSQEMWEQYGGLDYAPRADEASRSQQIAVAEKVLDAKGPQAWPSCSILAGLTKSDDSADVDPGVSASPQPTGSSDVSDTSESPDGSDASHEKSHGKSGKSGASDSASDAPSADASGDTSGNAASDEPADNASGNSDKSGQKGSTSPADPESSASATPAPSSDPAESGGRHRGDRAADDAAGSADSRTGEGRHASREDRRDDGSYTVRSGDNLWDIADAHDVQGGWTALYDLNKKTVGADPDLILPGQSLDLGLESGEK